VAVRCEIAAAHRQQRVLLRFCKSRVHVQCGFRCISARSTTSVAIELDQPLVADPEVMRDLVEHDVPDLAA
jgi:hypothetical protein